MTAPAAKLQHNAECHEAAPAPIDRVVPAVAANDLFDQPLWAHDAQSHAYSALFAAPFQFALGVVKGLHTLEGGDDVTGIASIASLCELCAGRVSEESVDHAGCGLQEYTWGGFCRALHGCASQGSGVRRYFYRLKN